MTPSTAHADARDTAARLAALTVSYDLLTAGSTLELLDAVDAVLVSIPLDNPPAVLDEENLTITLTVPIEGVRVDSDAIASARILDGSDALWADLTVSTTGNGGDLQIESLSHDTGTFIIITSAVFQG